MKTAQGKTPGAMRAASVIAATYDKLLTESLTGTGVSWKPDDGRTTARLAEIIDRKTAARELLEALQFSVRVLAAGDISERDIQAVYRKAEAAIKKA